MYAAKCRYALLTFQAEGIRRTHDMRPLVELQGVNDKTAGNAVTLLEANAAMNDGLSHTLIKPLPEGFTLQQLKVALLTESEAPRLTLQRLELLSEVPEVFCTEISAETTSPKDGFVSQRLGECSCAGADHVSCPRTNCPASRTRTPARCGHAPGATPHFQHPLVRMRL